MDRWIEEIVKERKLEWMSQGAAQGMTGATLSLTVRLPLASSDETAQETGGKHDGVRKE